MVSIRSVAAAADTLGEAPLWCSRTNRLWWVDIASATLKSLDPETGECDAVVLPGKTVGSFAFRKQGGFLVAIDNRLVVFELGKEVVAFADPEPDIPTNRMNDGKADRRGRYWVGSMDAAISRPSGSFHRIDPDGSTHAMFDDVLTPNSVAFSPDDRTLYFSDTRRFRIWAFDLDIETGNIANRRLFRDTTGHRGRPDGSTVDSEGYLWNAEFAGWRIVRYAPDGEIDRVIEVPVEQPTSVAFGGPDLKTLFITTARLNLTPEKLLAQPLAGHVLAVDLDVAGVAEPRFG